MAVQSGVVSQVYTSPTFGNVLKYKTDNGYEIMYAHLKEALVSEGDRIEKGQVVALSGNTGLSTGAHLHYTIFNGSEVIDPLSFVELPYTAVVKAEYAALGKHLR